MDSPSSLPSRWISRTSRLIPGTSTSQAQVHQLQQLTNSAPELFFSPWDLACGIDMYTIIDHARFGRGSRITDPRLRALRAAAAQCSINIILSPRPAHIHASVSKDWPRTILSALSPAYPPDVGKMGFSVALNFLLLTGVLCLHRTVYCGYEAVFPSTSPVNYDQTSCKYL